MNIANFVADLRRLGIELWTDGDVLRYRAPKGALTPALRAELADRKRALLTFMHEREVALFSTSPPVLNIPRDGALPLFFTQTPPLVPVPRNQNLPLSFAQERLWVLEQLGPGVAIYSFGMRLSGVLNVLAVEQSLNEIVRRHEVLRTTFATVEGRPVQVIAPALTLALPEVDLREVPQSVQEAEVQRLVDAYPLFDLKCGPLIRVILLRCGEQDHVLDMAIHQIVYDGWSSRIFSRELAALYNAFTTGRPSPLSELSIQYADFAAWQRRWLQGKVLEAQLAYWEQQLGGRLPVLELPNDRPRTAVPTFQGKNYSFGLPVTLSETLKAMSRREDATLFMTLLTAFKMLLSYYTGRYDILVGSPVANRTRVETEGLIGRFMQPLVLRTDLSGTPSFRTLLARVRQVCLEAYTHQETPFEMLVQALRPAEWNRNRMPLFQVLFTLDDDNLLMPALELSRLTVSPLATHDAVAMRGYDLYLLMQAREQQLIATLRYNIDLFEVATTARIADDFETLLSIVVADPEVKLNELVEMLAEKHKQQLVTKEKELEEAGFNKLKTIKRKRISA